MNKTLKQLESANIPNHIKGKMSTIIRNQQRNNSDTQEAYKCSKCKDKTDDEALFCECRALREFESILR